MSTLSIAASGMKASAAKLAASASNIANARNTGPVPDRGTVPGAVEKSLSPRAYQAMGTVNVETRGGGVSAQYAAQSPLYRSEYEPNAPYADKSGMVAAPNVDYAEEALRQIEAVYAYKANARVFTAADQMMAGLLNKRA